MEPTTIYASNHRVWLDVFLLGLVVAIALGLSLTAFYGTLSGVLVGVFFLAVAVAFGRWGLQALGLARRPLPVIFLDEDGFACAFGRVNWESVESVTRSEPEGEPYINFALRADTIWQPVETSYASYPVDLFKGGFRVGLRTVHGLSVDDVNRYRAQRHAG